VGAGNPCANEGFTGADAGGGSSETCYIVEDGMPYICDEYGAVPGAALGIIMSECSMLMGTLMPSCPTANQIGCCQANKNPSTGACYYMSGLQSLSASQLAASCAKNGTWIPAP
jgi:hypothetical protein